MTVANRTAAAAAALVDRFAGVGTGARGRPWPWTAAAFAAALAAADLAVNATTVGMLDPGMTIPVERLPATATVFDLVYVPAETPLLAAARARGLRAANGSEMLIAQAAIAFERWTGVGGMADVMRAAVAPLLADAAAPRLTDAPRDDRRGRPPAVAVVREERCLPVAPGDPELDPSVRAIAAGGPDGLGGSRAWADASRQRRTGRWRRRAGTGRRGPGRDLHRRR